MALGGYQLDVRFVRFRLVTFSPIQSYRFAHVTTSRRELVDYETSFLNLCIFLYPSSGSGPVAEQVSKFASFLSPREPVPFPNLNHTRKQQFDTRRESNWLVPCVVICYNNTIHRARYLLTCHETHQIRAIAPHERGKRLSVYKHDRCAIKKKGKGKERLRYEAYSKRTRYVSFRCSRDTKI